MNVVIEIPEKVNVYLLLSREWGRHWVSDTREASCVQFALKAASLQLFSGRTKCRSKTSSPHTLKPSCLSLPAWAKSRCSIKKNILVRLSFTSTSPPPLGFCYVGKVPHGFPLRVNPGKVLEILVWVWVWVCVGGWEYSGMWNCEITARENSFEEIEVAWRRRSMFTVSRGLFCSEKVKVESKVFHSLINVLLCAAVNYAPRVVCIGRSKQCKSIGVDENGIYTLFNNLICSVALLQPRRLSRADFMLLHCPESAQNKATQPCQRMPPLWPSFWTTGALCCAGHSCSCSSLRGMWLSSRRHRGSSLDVFGQNHSELRGGICRNSITITQTQVWVLLISGTLNQYWPLNPIRTKKRAEQVLQCYCAGLCFKIH